MLIIITNTLLLVLVDCETGENMTDSGVDSELSPSSPDSITETSTNTATTTTPSMVIQTPTNNCETVARSAEELVAKMEEDEEDEEESECEDKIADKMETVEALLSLSEASRSPVGSPEKPLITILPAHNPDKGETDTLSLRLRDGNICL